MKSWKKMTKAERAARERELDERIAMLRELERRGREELARREAAKASASGNAR